VISGLKLRDFGDTFLSLLYRSSAALIKLLCEKEIEQNMENTEALTT